MRRLLVAGVVCCIGLLLLVADARPVPTAIGVSLPTPNVQWDYQIGGAFTPARRVGVVSRDRNAAPSPGDPVVDGQLGGGEFLLDTGRAGKRAALADIVGEWIDGCAADGFDAVEFDNLDSWDRGRGLISRADNEAFARLLTARAHAAGLAAAQKNWAELSPRGPQIGFDLAVAEECGRWRECGSYARAYDDRVYVVEYLPRPGLRPACERWGSRLSIVRRNLAVTPAGANRGC